MYRPLPDGLTIKESNVQGLGLFATQDFEADLILGIVHVMNKNFPHGAIRTALGAFYNHSEEPNCINVKGLASDGVNGGSRYGEMIFDTYAYNLGSTFFDSGSSQAGFAGCFSYPNYRDCNVCNVTELRTCP